MADSIFTRIIRGEVPCHKVYEDALTFAFVDMNPKIPGHTLVVPKKQVEFIWDLEESDYQALMASAKKVGKRIREVLHPKYVGMQVEGAAVPHAHVHVFPFNTTDEFHIRQVPGVTAPDEELAEMAKKLAF